MKRTALLKKLRKIAKTNDTTFELVRQGGGHEIWAINGRNIVIPRHTEINEMAAKSIIRTATEEATK